MRSRKLSSTYHIIPTTPIQNKNQCEICEAKFQLLLNQEHICKICLRKICQKCIGGKSKTFTFDGQPPAPHKICIICKKQQELILALIAQNGLVFRSSSRLSQQWVKKQNSGRLSFQKIINEYQQKKIGTNSTNQNIIRFKSQRIQLFDLLFKNLNFSQKQFIGRMVEQVRPQIVTASMSYVMVAIYSHLPYLPYTPELVQVVLFLLCFSNQSQCYFILSRFIEKTYPQYQKIQTNKDALGELKVLKDMYSVLVRRPDQNQIAQITHFMQNTFIGFMKSLTVNCANVPLSFYLLDQILTYNSYIYLYKGIVAMTFICRQQITSHTNTSSDIIQTLHYLVKQGTLDKLKNVMVYFQKSNVKFQMVHQFFDSPEHKKLYQKYKKLQSTHEKEQQKHKELQQKYNKLVETTESTKNIYEQASIKKMELQQQLLSLSDKIILLQDLQMLQKENIKLTKINSQTSQELHRLTQEYQQLNKKYTMEQISRKMYIKMQEDYQQQIVELKTKNQVYQIQKLANNIDFQTTYIDRKFQDKNKRILELQRDNQQLRSQIQFYKTSRKHKNAYQKIYGNGTSHQEEDPFIKNINNILKTQQNGLNFNLDYDLTSLYQLSKPQRSSFKKLLQACKQIIDQLKSDLGSNHSQRLKQKNQLKQLTQLVEGQRKELQLMDEVNNIVNQVPQQMNYVASIENLQSILQKQNNIHRKTQLESILASFRKCHYEVRFRAIDAKLKQNQLGQQNNIDKSKDEKNQELNVSELLQWFGNSQEITELNKKVLKKDDACTVM